METEIERMVVKIEGDAKAYEKEIKRLVEVTGLTEQQVSSAMKKIQQNEAETLREFQKAEEQARAESERGWAGWKNKVTGYIMGVARDVASYPQEILKLDNTARNAGVSIGDLRAAALWAGTSIQEVTTAVSSLQQKLADLRGGSVDTAREFKNLAAVSGVAYETLYAGRWSTVIEAISKIENPAHRAAQAYRMLGSSAGGVLRQLEQGGLNKALNVADKLGLNVSQQDAANIQKVMDTVNQIQAIGTGVFNQILIGLAPVAAEFTKLFDAAKIDLTWISKSVTDIALSLGQWGARVAAAFSSFDLMDQAIGVLGDTMVSAGQQFWEFMEEKFQKFADRWLGVFARRPSELFTGRREERTREIGPIIARNTRRDDLMRALDNSPIGQMFREFKEGVNANRGRPDAKVDPVDAAQNTAKLNQQLASALSGIADPLKDFKNAIEDIGSYQRAGLFEGATGGRSRDMLNFQAFQRLQSGTTGTGPAQFAGAAEAFSRESFSAINQFRYQQQQGTIEDKILASMKMAERQRELQLQIGKQVAAALARIAEDGGGGID